MSQENVEIVRSLLAAFNRQDADAVGDLWTTDGEWYPAYIGGGLLEGAAFRGREGMIEFVELQRETWESVVAEPVDMRDLGEHVLVEVHLRAVGRASGTPVERITWNVFEVRDGKAASGKVYKSEDEALEAVGLKTQAMSQDNVDNLRAFWETWNTSEAPDMSLLDPEVTYEDTILPDHVGETYRGHEGIARAVARWFEPFAEVTISLERIVGEGDCLVSIHRVRTKARHTGIVFESPLAYVYTLREGKCIHFKSFWDPQQALDAAGLAE